MLVLVALVAPGEVAAEQIKLDVSASHPFLQSDKKQTTFLKVSMTGFSVEGDARRVPMNVALVLDKSGSMSGGKIEKAKEAAALFVERLSPSDILSVVAYESTVHVLVPATKASDRSLFLRGIRQLSADGSTALFAGVSKGAEEVRKFMDKNRVNRVVLLSDGLANVGPSSPAELAALGASLIKEGISVTTLGLGLDYNEDLMTQLATKADGNHAFLKSSDELEKFFEMELDSVLAVAAQDVIVKIECSEGIRPIRVLGRDADITGQVVTSSLNQLYSNHERYVLLEIEVPETPESISRELATVTVSYSNMQTKTRDVLTSAVSVRFTHLEAKVQECLNSKVFSSAVAQIATLNNDAAVALRDRGMIEEARKVLLENVEYLKKFSDRLNSQELKELESINCEDAKNLDPENWLDRRKMMRDNQQKIYLGPSY